MAKPDEKVTPEQILSEFEYLRKQAESLSKNLEYLSSSISQISMVIESLKEIKDLKKANELLIPLGAGAFISAKINDREKVILNIGADVSVKKEIGEGIEVLESRRNEMGEAYNNLNERLQPIHQKLEMMSPIVEQIMGSNQGAALEEISSR